MLKYLSACLAMLMLLSFSKLFSYTEPHRLVFKSKTNQNSVIKADTLQTSEDALKAARENAFFEMISFAGEKIPAYNENVRQRFAKALSRVKPHLTANKKLLEKNARTMNYIDKILVKYGIPGDFRYLPIIESRLSNDVSHKGAAGFWQLMPATARSLGLRVDSVVDERNDLVKSTVAASKYIKSLYRQLGSWTLAAAAYNTGPGTIQREMKQQATNSYYHLDLSKETENYLFRVIAMKELMQYPGRYAKFI